MYPFDALVYGGKLLIYFAAVSLMVFIGLFLALMSFDNKETFMGSVIAVGAGTLAVCLLSGLGYKIIADAVDKGTQ